MIIFGGFFVEFICQQIIKAVGKVFGMQMYERRKEIRVEGAGLPAGKLKRMYH
ncbi:hypothetical protein [Lacihabitans lacunae]|uniref:Translocase n=1 Tax=Lacihabitans lacunae TaxID=1028214 RepID=A0ABV7YWG3_9BACT